MAQILTPRYHNLFPQLQPQYSYGPDVTAPRINSVVVGSDGESVTVVFSEDVNFGSGEFLITASVSPTSVPLTYVSGSGGFTWEFTPDRILGQGEVCVLTYVAPIEAGGVEDLNGNLLPTIPTFSVTNLSQVDRSPPVGVDAEVLFSATEITVGFDEPIFSGTGGLAGFSILASGGPVSVSSASLFDQTIELTVSRQIESSESVEIIYTPPIDGIRDSYNNFCVGFSGLLAFNGSGYDITPPQLSSASVLAAGTVLRLVFNEEVEFGVAGGVGYALTTDGAAVTLTYSSGASTSTLDFTISRALERTEHLTLAYTSGATRTLDLAGNMLASFSGTEVSNNSTVDTIAPTLLEAYINGSKDTLILRFSEEVEFGAGGNGGFALTASGGAVTATYQSGEDDLILRYSLNRVVAFTETVTLAYTQPGNGVQDFYGGNDLANFSGTAVGFDRQAPASIGIKLTGGMTL